jgi:hypothetical protein
MRASATTVIAVARMAGSYNGFDRTGNGFDWNLSLQERRLLETLVPPGIQVQVTPLL